MRPPFHPPFPFAFPHLAFAFPQHVEGRRVFWSGGHQRSVELEDPWGLHEVTDRSKNARSRIFGGGETQQKKLGPGLSRKRRHPPIVPPSGEKFTEHPSIRVGGYYRRGGLIEGGV